MKSIKRTAFASLEVARLGRAEWRVSSSSDPRRLLGFIERQRGGRFEVLWMTDPLRWGYTDSFESALIAFGDGARFSGEIREERARATERV